MGFELTTFRFAGLGDTVEFVGFGNRCFFTTKVAWDYGTLLPQKIILKTLYLMHLFMQNGYNTNSIIAQIFPIDKMFLISKKEPGNSKLSGYWV